MRLVVTALVSLMGVASCLLFVPLDGLSGEPGSDGGSDALAAGDSGAGDTGAGDTGGGDAAAASFCATQSDAGFCEDFDEQPLPGAFDDRSAVGADIALDPTLSVSPRYSFGVTIPTDTGNAEHNGAVGRALPPGSPLVILNAKVHLVKVPTANGAGPRASIFSLTCGNSAAQSLLVLIVFVRPTASGGANVWLTSYTPAGTISADLTAFATMPVGTWQELRVTTDWPSRTMSLHAIDASGAVLLGSGTFKPPADLVLPPPWCGYDVGVFSNMPQDGWSVRYDDVVIRTP